MQGVLYVSHGSRVKEATDEAKTFIHSVMEQVDAELQEICFLELAEPTVEQGITALVNKGAASIAVIPVLLLGAGHYYQDIPQEVRRVREQHPAISFTYGEPLGVQDRFTEVLQERMSEASSEVNLDAKILLVGRGSRHPETKRDIQTIGKKLQIKTGLPVNVCFLAATKPDFEAGLKAALNSKQAQIIIVPYLWFTGILMRDIEQKIAELETDKEVLLSRQLGGHMLMKKALSERVYEAMN